MAWKPWENPADVDDYFHVPTAPPREILGPVIKDYRSLRYLATPRGVEFNPECFAESGGVPPRDWGPEDQRKWQNTYNVWEATQPIRDLFLECGWNTGTVEQTIFRRDEFITRRDRYWREVVEPLIMIEDTQ